MHLYTVRSKNINEDAAKSKRKRTIQTAGKGAMMCQVSEYSPGLSVGGLSSSFLAPAHTR